MNLPCSSSVVLLVLLAAPGIAVAQSCTSLYSTTDPVPVDLYTGRPTDRLPTPDLSAISTRDNGLTLAADPVGSCDSGADWCSEARAIVPFAGIYEDQLFLFLHGAGNKPNDHEHVLYTAAYAGMRAIGLPWDGFSADLDGGGSQTLTRLTVCQDLVDHDGDPNTPDEVSAAACDDPCDHDMAIELLSGVEVDDAISPYDAHPMRSITHRAALVLNDLYLDDINGDNDNDYGWDAFCSVSNGATAIEWSDIVVGGFSMGGTMATFISYTEGAHGHLVLDGGTDICTDTSVGQLSNPDYVSTYTPCGSSCDNAVGFWHEDFNAGLLVAAEPDVLTYAGFVYDDSSGADEPVDVDCYLEGSLACYSSGLPYGFTPSTPNVMMTSQRPASGGPHTSMAHDTDMPTNFKEFGSAGFPPGSADPALFETPELHLFPAYLEAMCSLI